MANKRFLKVECIDQGRKSNGIRSDLPNGSSGLCLKPYIGINSFFQYISKGRQRAFGICPKEAKKNRSLRTRHHILVLQRIGDGRNDFAGQGCFRVRVQLREVVHCIHFHFWK